MFACAVMYITNSEWCSNVGQGGGGGATTPYATRRGGDHILCKKIVNI